MLGTMGNIFNFGLLTGVTLIFALASDFFLAPAMMELVRLANTQPAVPAPIII